MHFTENDYKEYINIYENNKGMGVSFDYLFMICHRELDKKKKLLDKIHNDPNHDPTLTNNIMDKIDDYTMSLLSIFFTLNSTNNMFSYVKKNFIEEYVKNESELEGFDEKSPNVKEMRLGLETMYRFLCSPENNATRGSTMLTDLHEKLYSHVEYGKYAREYRTEPVIHFFGDIEVPEPHQIIRAMLNTDKQFDELYEEANKIYNSDNRIDMINPFLEELMKYSVEVIRIQPFFDGNKRSVRGVINFLLERAGLPPVYVKVSEDEKYKDALEDAIIDKNYKTITNFYKNKLCDSIEELVINPFEQAIEMYKEEEKKKSENKADGNNVKRLFLQNDGLIKPKENKQK